MTRTHESITHNTEISMELIKPHQLERFRTVPVPDGVSVYRVSWYNALEARIVGHLFIDESIDRSKKHPAIIISHPMGAVKEQGADVYAAYLAKEGFITLGFDQMFWGESEGNRRNSINPDAYTETWMSAVDFMGTRDFVDRERIGAIGICGNGSFLISAAKLDPRIKAIATAAMYDMGDVTRRGLERFGAPLSLEGRKAQLKDAAEKRYIEFTTGQDIFSDSLPLDLPEDPDDITAEFHSFYRMARGEVVPADTERSLAQNRTYTNEIKFMNFYPFNDIETISPRPMLFVTGTEAHSKEFSEKAYEQAGENKELFWVEGANHIQLYDDVDHTIPWSKFQSFFKENL